jgi:signal transduction histidine kinase/AraC-like DNA-binding protein/ABC-type sugar transport system substrate-binding protein
MENCLRVGLCIGTADAFWVQVTETIYQRSLQHPVELIPFNQSSFFSVTTNDEKNALLEEIVSQEVDVLLGWSFPEALAYPVLDMGIPIVHLFETRIEHPLSVSPFGLQTIAEELARYLAALLQFRGNVLVIGGLLRDELPDDGRSRIIGIQNAFQQYPDIHFHHLLTDWGRDTAEAQLRAWLPTWKQSIDAIYGLSDSLALLGREITLELGKCNSDIPVVGINGDPLALAAILEEQMAATVETPATTLANHAFDIAVKIANGQSYPAHYPFNHRLITAENVANVASKKLVSIANLPNRLINDGRTEQQQYQHYLETSLDISRQIGSVLDYQRIPVELARLIRTNYDYDHVQLFYWSEREQILTLAEDAESGLVSRRISLLTAGVLGEALTQDKPVFIPDSLRSFRFAPDPECPNTRSRVILPIRQGEVVLGLLDLHAYRVMHCTRQHLLGLQSLADQMGVAIRNAQLYTEALKAKAQAEKADKLKSRLLANISHELRNPLHVILNQADKLETAVSTAESTRQIQHNARHLLRLINDLLDLSRAEIDELSISTEMLEPVAFLNDVFASMASQEQSGVQWQLDIPDQLPLIQADPDRLRQILLNLLSNARKFTPHGEIVLGANVESPHFHIWVHDTGLGIPAHQQQTIFEPFVTGVQESRRKEGVGLGLSITRRLVALHGGVMTLDSQPDKGSTFHVYLALPNLVNVPLPAKAGIQPILLVVSMRETIPAHITAYSYQQELTLHRVQTYGEIDSLLRAGLPAAIAWDAQLASEAEWQLIQRLYSHPQFSHVPFLMYGYSDDLPATPSVTGVLLKPIKPKTLLNIISATFKAEANGMVLIVDDDADMRSMYRDVIMQQFPAYGCQTAASGTEALAVMESDIPSFVILDLLMPEMDGFDVINWMRANSRTRHVPITILSGKILTFEDIKRLEPHHKIMFQSKHVLSEQELVATFQKMLFEDHPLPPQTSTVVKQAVAYIHQHYQAPFSRSEIAHALGVSENYLTHIFHRETGIALWDYLNRYRVVQAKDLLREKNDSVAIISAEVGFDDPAYFSRVFRRYVGQSPRVYRKGDME